MPRPKPRAYAQLCNDYPIITIAMQEHMQQLNPFYSFTERTRSAITEYLIAAARYFDDDELTWEWSLTTTTDRIFTAFEKTETLNDREATELALSNETYASVLINAAQERLIQFYLSADFSSFEGNDAGSIVLERCGPENLNIKLPSERLNGHRFIREGDHCSTDRMKRDISFASDEHLVRIYCWIKTLEKDLSCFEEDIVYEIDKILRLDLMSTKAVGLQK